MKKVLVLTLAFMPISVMPVWAHDEHDAWVWCMVPTADDKATYYSDVFPGTSALLEEYMKDILKYAKEKQWNPKFSACSPHDTEDDAVSDRDKYKSILRRPSYEIICTSWRPDYADPVIPADPTEIRNQREPEEFGHMPNQPEHTEVDETAR